jgi:hypothetical protein
MATERGFRSNSSAMERRLYRQKQCRRKSNLMKKACEYSKMCDADLCLGIRLRGTGRIFWLSADTAGFWTFLSSQVVGI